MKKLFSLLALSTIISFTANSVGVTCLNCSGGNTGTPVPEISVSETDMIDADVIALDNRLAEPASEHSYFSKDASSPIGVINHIGEKSIIEMRTVAADYAANIEAATPSATNPHRTGYEQDIINEAAEVEQIVVAEGERLEARLNDLLARYDARTGAEGTRNDAFRTNTQRKAQETSEAVSRKATAAKTKMDSVAGSSSKYRDTFIRVSGGRK